MDARFCLAGGIRCIKGYSISILISILVSMFDNGRMTVRPYTSLFV